jgi:hypothetical protein
MSNEVEIPLKLTGVGSLKAELRSLKAEIASASDPEQMAKLAQKAGEVADKIKDANEQVKVFTTGSKFEAISNSFSSIGDDLMSLDFEGASEKAATFQKTVGSLGKAEISGAIKGLGKTVTTLGSTFVKLGAQILMNPIFLLVAVIVAIVAAIVIFLNKIGVLQKVLDFLMAPINLLIDGFKWLTDAIGLTSYAAEENAEKIKKANEEIIASSQQRAEAQGAAYDFEIEKAKISGKDTTQLEVQKSKSITNEATLRRNRMMMELKAANKIASEDNAEQRKKLKESIRQENITIRQGSRERILIQLRETQAKKEQYKKQREDAKKAAEDQAKEDAKAAAEAAKEAAARWKEKKDAIKKATEDIQKEIAVANKLVVDSTKTQQQKEVDDVKDKYAALIAEATKYKQDIVALEKARDLEIKGINDAAAKDAEDKRIAQAEKVKAENEKKYQLEDQQWLKLQELTIKNDNDAAEYRKLQAQIQFDNDTANLEDTSALYIALKSKLQTDLNLIDKETKDKALEKEREYNDLVIKAQQDLASAKYGALKGGLDMIASLAGENKKIANALFLVDKALAIGEVVVNTQKEIAAYSANPTWSLMPDGGASIKVPMIAAAKIRAATSIGTIVASSIGKFMNGGGASVSGGGGGGTAPTSNASSGNQSSIQSFVPGNLFGGGNDSNNLKSASAMDSSNQPMIVKAVVSETEITSTQNKVNKIIKNSEL